MSTGFSPKKTTPLLKTSAPKSSAPKQRSRAATMSCSARWSNTLSAKEELRDIVEQLDEGLAEIWLEFLRTGDPALRSLLLAPIDDEPTTPEENAGVDKAWADYQRGEFITAEEAKARLLS